MTYHVSSLMPDAASNLFFSGSGGHSPEVHTVTASHFANRVTVDRFVMGSLMCPPLYTKDFQPRAIDHANKKLLFRGRQLNNWYNYRDGYLDGATIDVMRMVDDRLVEMGSATVTKCTIKGVRPFWMWRGDKVVAKGVGRAHWSPSRDYRVGATIHVVVAAIDDQGRRGPWSAVDSTYAVPAGQEVNSISPESETSPAPDFYEQESNPALAVPTGVTVTPLNNGRTVEVSWDADPNLRYVVGVSDTADIEHEESLTLTDTSFIGPGDLIILRKRFDHTQTRAKILNEPFWGTHPLMSFVGLSSMGLANDLLPAGVKFELMEDEEGPFARWNVEAGASHTFTFFTHGGPRYGDGREQHYYNMLDPEKQYYTRVIARRESGTGGMSLRVERTVEGEKPVPLTDQWATYETVLTPLANQLSLLGLATTKLTLKGPLVMDLRFLTLAEHGTEPNGLAPFFKETLLHGAPGFVRDHSCCKTKPGSYSMREYLSPYGNSFTHGVSLPMLLNVLTEARNSPEGRALREKVGRPILQPWFQVEPYFLMSEWQMLGGFLCTEYNEDDPESPFKEGARMRVSQGRIRPWQEEFEGIIGEVGNENWNYISEFFLLPSVNGKSAGYVNGKLLDRMAEGIMAAPGYDPSKIRFYLGGWNLANPYIPWNVNSIAGSVHADLFGFADYNGGWDSGLTAALSVDDPIAVLRTLANSSIAQLGKSRHPKFHDLVQMCAEKSIGRAKPLRAMNYEAGPGYVLNGLNGATVTADERRSQEALLKSVAAGTATLDAFLANTSQGVISSNFFTIGAGTEWKARAKWQNGGSFYPSYQWFGFANQNLNGVITLLDPLSAEPLVDGKGVRHGNAVRVYRIYRDDGSTAYAIVNIDPANAHEVKLRELPVGGNWTRHWMSGTMLTHNNTLETAGSVSILSETMPEGFGRGGFTVTIPRGQAEVYIRAA